MGSHEVSEARVRSFRIIESVTDFPAVGGGSSIVNAKKDLILK